MDLAARKPASVRRTQMTSDLRVLPPSRAAKVSICVCILQWRKVHQPPFKPLYRRPKSIENCNIAMAIMRDKMRLQLVNIGGEDIVNAEGKLIRALLWQLMRCMPQSPQRHAHLDEHSFNLPPARAKQHLSVVFDCSCVDWRLLSKLSS